MAVKLCKYGIENCKFTKKALADIWDWDNFKNRSAKVYSINQGDEIWVYCQILFRPDTESVFGVKKMN